MSSRDLSNNLERTTTFFNGHYDAESVTVTICCALAIYNALELLILIFTTFRRYSGLYFWSLLVASTGVLPYCFGFMIGYFRLANQIANEVISTVGWVMMVTGQSFVLYSRLGVVLGPTYATIHKATKWMIIVDGIVFHVSTTTVFIGTYNAQPNYNWAQAYKYIEKIQMTGFTIQEFILSGLYVWRTLDILKAAPEWNLRRKRIMRELLAINIIIILMDVALLVVEYQNRHVIEQSIKQVVYSVKLKLEFAILSKLVDISHRSESTATFDETATLDQAGDKKDVSHVERTMSFLSDSTHPSNNAAIRAAPSITLVESQDPRKRDLYDGDTYASYCLDISNKSKM